MKLAVTAAAAGMFTLGLLTAGPALASRTVTGSAQACAAWQRWDNRTEGGARIAPVLAYAMAGDARGAGWPVRGDALALYRVIPETQAQVVRLEHDTRLALRLSMADDAMTADCLGPDA